MAEDVPKQDMKTVKDTTSRCTARNHTEEHPAPIHTEKTDSHPVMHHKNMVDADSLWE